MNTATQFDHAELSNPPQCASSFQHLEAAVSQVDVVPGCRAVILAALRFGTGPIDEVDRRKVSEFFNDYLVALGVNGVDTGGESCGGDLGHRDSPEVETSYQSFVDVLSSYQVTDAELRLIEAAALCALMAKRRLVNQQRNPAQVVP